MIITMIHLMMFFISRENLHFANPSYQKNLKLNPDCTFSVDCCL